MKGRTVSNYVNEPLATVLARAEGTVHAVPLEGFDTDAGRIVLDFDRYNI
jgi:hypothetical protein